LSEEALALSKAQAMSASHECGINAYESSAASAKPESNSFFR